MPIWQLHDACDPENEVKSAADRDERDGIVHDTQSSSDRDRSSHGLARYATWDC